MIIKSRKVAVALVAGAALVAVGLDTALTIAPDASSPTASTPSSTRASTPGGTPRFSRLAVPPAPTVGQTLSVTDMQIPVTRPADASPPPTGWSSRVTFKGCGQTVSIRARVGKTILFYNGGSVSRYFRATGGIPLHYTSHTVVAHDWREATFKTTGTKVVTFTTATCTLWSPKVVINVTP